MMLHSLEAAWAAGVMVYSPQYLGNSVAPDNRGYPQNFFSYFYIKQYNVGTHWKRLVEVLLMTATTYVFVEKQENY